VTFEAWLAFVLAAAVLLAIPGPTVMLVVGCALAHGRRSALGTVPGVALGDLTAITVSFIGLGALLSAWPAVFGWVKWVGAAYLVLLGVRMWRARPGDPAAPALGGASRRAMFRQAWTITTLNPKSILFFVAFLPQFITPARPPLPQMAILGTTFVTLAALNASLYALLAGAVRASLNGQGTRKTVQRLGGSILIGAGVFMAGWA